MSSRRHQQQRQKEKHLMNRFPDAISSTDALQTLFECPWAPKGQWKVFPEGKLTPKDSPQTAETYLQTICLLTGQRTVYTDGSATVGTKDGGTGVIVTFSDPADAIILHRSQLRGAVFPSSFAKETRIRMGHHQPYRALTHNLHRQSIATQGN